MAVRTFAAIDVGSYELGMKIFEFTSKGGMKEIDYIRRSIDLGTQTYQSGKISRENMDELCNVLSDFSEIMKMYKVDSYKAYGTSAIRETKNTLIITEQIKLRTGIRIDVLSNSEQRFLHYKAAASKGDIFVNFIKEGCAIVDIGGGSIQISLFDEDSLVTTQNIRLGVLRTMDMLSKLKPTTKDIDSVLNELIDNQLEVFKNLYLEEREIKNIILIDDYISMLFNNEDRDRRFTAKSFGEKSKELKHLSPAQIAQIYSIPEESAAYLLPAAALVKRVLKITKAENIWSPGVTLCDGMAYEYGQKENLIKEEHDFENDIIECATVMSRRYKGNLDRNKLIEQVAMGLFDATRKIHGMSKRERLLLRIVALLNDCGRYISIDAGAECGYDIIMATEMIGLSHDERAIVANVVRFNKTEFRYYSDLAAQTLMTKGNYLRIAKLSALFRLADGICRSYDNKIEDVKYNLKGDELVISVSAKDSIELEQGFFERKSSLFEEAFSITPVLKASKRKKTLN